MSFDQAIVLVAVGLSVAFALTRLVRFLRSLGDRPSDPRLPPCGTSCAGCAAVKGGGGCGATDGHALPPDERIHHRPPSPLREDRRRSEREERRP